MRGKRQKAYASIAETKSIMSLRLTANRAAILFLTLAVCFSVFAAGALACTAIYAGRGTTANGSVFMGRSEDYGPDFVKHFVIIPAADHKPGEMIEEDHGFRVPYPAHTLRYSAVMDDPSKYKVQRSVPFGEAGVNEKGVSVSATVTTRFNERVRAADPLTAGGITEMSITSYILQSAESAMDGVAFWQNVSTSTDTAAQDLTSPTVVTSARSLSPTVKRHGYLKLFRDISILLKGCLTIPSQ